MSAKKEGRPVDQAQIYFPPPDAEGGWRTLRNVDEIWRLVGMDQKKLDEAFALIHGSKRQRRPGGLMPLLLACGIQ